MPGSPARPTPSDRPSTPSPSRRNSLKGVLRIELADAARQLGSQRQLQYFCCLSFLAGAVWAVTLVGLGAAPLAQFQRHGGEKMDGEKGGGWRPQRRGGVFCPPTRRESLRCSAFMEGRVTQQR